MNGYANAYELYQALDRGTATIFTYNDEVFHVRKPAFRVTEITDKQGNIARCGFYFAALIDYQGIAANLQKSRKHLFFDKDGNELNGIGIPKRADAPWKDEVENLHKEAMDIMEEWEFSRDPEIRKNKEIGKAAAMRAVQLEKKAAELIPLDESYEPSRSVMYRSAASLALMAGFWIMAISLANEGLKGAKHTELVVELEEVRDEAQVKFDAWKEKGGDK